MLNGNLLIGRKRFAQLFVFSQAGNHLETFTSTNDGFVDATWTPRGNIVYTTNVSKRVVVMSKSGDIIKHTQMTNPQELSVSNDGVIYLADCKSGIYNSTDDGLTWNFLDGWLCRHVFKVTTDHGNEFWTHERGYNLLITRYAQIHVFSEQALGGSAAQSKDISFNTPDGRRLCLEDSRLVYDGFTNVFLNERNNKAVHLLTVNGQYRCQLLSSGQIKNQPCRLAVDKECQQLYVGQRGGIVEVFKLKYGE